MNDLLSSYYMSSTINAVKQLPKEFVYAAVAGLTVNEIHKRHAQVKTEEIKAQAKTRELELEVEKLSLQLALHNARAEKPLT
jgi:methyl coenzyme M reductase subunit D